MHFVRHFGAFSIFALMAAAPGLAVAAGSSDGSTVTSKLYVDNKLSTKQDASTAVKHTANTKVGSATQPVYVDTDGTAKATTYSLNKTVPSDAKFTDTTYTFDTGTTDGTISVTQAGGSAQSVAVKNAQTTTNLIKQESATGSVLSDSSTDTTYPSAKAVYKAITSQGYITSASLPTVNNATLTVQQNGTSKGTFTANSATNQTINIVADANVIETVKAAGTALTVTDKAVNIPTMGAASSSAAGTAGLVPVPTAGSQNKVLTGAGTWVAQPTVNDATLTVQKNGTTIDTFTANASANKTINVTVPTTVSELTDSGNYELVSRKLQQGSSTSSVITSSSDDTKYPSAKAVYKAITSQGYITSASLPTVNNKTLTIQQNGTSKGTFTANSATDQTVNIVADANVIETVKAAGTALTVTDKAVNIPTMGAASSSAAGTAGLVPASSAGDQAKVLTAAGTWVAQPTVNNATLTVQKNGTTIDTFTANASANKTINVTVPTTVSELTDSGNYELVSRKLQQGSSTSSVITSSSDDTKYPSAKAVYKAITSQGYITSASLPTVNNATLTIQQNGTSKGTFTANASSASTVNIEADKNVIETVKAAGTALTVTNKAVDIPTMGAASSSAAGTVGLVPASTTGSQNKVLTGGATWAYTQVPVASGDPNASGTVSNMASIWVE